MTRKMPLPKAMRYPWDKWFNGRIHKLTRGSDFRVDRHHFRVAAHKAKHRHGVSIECRLCDEDERVVYLRATKDR